MSQQIRWSQVGKTYLWRYSDNIRKLPGWHITADAEGRQSFDDLLKKLSAARYSCEQLVLVTPPTEEILGVPNYRGGTAKWRSCESFVLRYPAGKVATDTWELTLERMTLKLVLGASKLAQLIEGMAAIAEGRGDYAIGPEDESAFVQQCLWFWWHPDWKTRRRK